MRITSSFPLRPFYMRNTLIICEDFMCENKPLIDNYDYDCDKWVASPGNDWKRKQRINGKRMMTSWWLILEHADTFWGVWLKTLVQWSNNRVKSIEKKTHVAMGFVIFHILYNVHPDVIPCKPWKVEVCISTGIAQTKQKRYECDCI